MKKGKEAKLALRAGRVFAKAILLSAFSVLHTAFFAGCSSPPVVFQADKSHPTLEMDGQYVMWNGERVSPYDVPEMLDEIGIDRKTTIHIRVIRLDANAAQAFRHVLARGGYSRTALVTKEHAEAWSKASRQPDLQSNPPVRPRIRYRSADED